MILDLIEKKPGIGFNEIAKQTNLSNGIISHYILQLLKNDEIVKSGVRAKYFVPNISVRDRKFIIILSNPTNLKIIKVLLEKGTSKSRDISKMIKKSGSTISVSLKNLEKAKIIGRKIMNEESKLTSDIGYNILNVKFVKGLILKYDLD